MSNETSVSNPTVSEIQKQFSKYRQEASLHGTIASDAEIKAAGGFTQNIWNAFVANAVKPDAIDINVFITRLKQHVDETGWPYESITAYFSAGNIPAFRIVPGSKVLLSSANSVVEGFYYTAFLTYP